MKLDSTTSHLAASDQTWSDPSASNISVLPAAPFKDIGKERRAHATKDSLAYSEPCRALVELMEAQQTLTRRHLLDEGSNSRRISARHLLLLLQSCPGPDMRIFPQMPTMPKAKDPMPRRKPLCELSSYRKGVSLRRGKEGLRFGSVSTTYQSSFGHRPLRYKMCSFDLVI